MTAISTTAVLREVMKNYFLSFDKREKKVAWCTSVGPAELLRSFGFEVFFPENHGALLGATRTAMDFIPEAAREGYSNHVCSYTTSDIGSWLKADSPLSKQYGLSGPPKPDLIVYNTNQCREVQDWFSFYAEKFRCPIAGIHPPRHLDQITKNDIDQVIYQQQSIIAACESVTGEKFDLDRFKETIKWSKEATHLWQDVLKTAKNHPAPLTFFDGVIHMGPIVVLRGTPQAKNYYEHLLAELKGKIASGDAAVPGERLRIFWEGMPIWGKIRMFSDLFAQNQTSVVASTYCSSWVFDEFDENEPFESTALAYTKIFINRSEKAKMEMLTQWLKEYSCDGILFHDSKTCFNNSNAKFGMPQRLREKTGIPCLLIEGDLCDLRFFSEGQSITKIETFIEQLESAGVGK